MRGFKLFISLLFGLSVTFLQLVAVGALNQSKVSAAEKTLARKVSRPLIVAKPPSTRRKPPRMQESPRTIVPQIMPAAAKLKTPELPALKIASANLGILNVLPGLGGVGLGSVEVPEVSREPDRPARVRRAAEPVYPIAAQRQGVEGYVIVRLSIDAQGSVSKVLVVDSEPMGVFEASAREAARRFEFTPARVDGRDASTTIEKKMVFRLQ